MFVSTRLLWVSLALLPLIAVLTLDRDVLTRMSGPSGLNDLQAEWQRQCNLDRDSQVVYQSIVSKTALVRALCDNQISLDDAIQLYAQIEETQVSRTTRQQRFPAATDSDSRRLHLVYLVELERHFRSGSPLPNYLAARDGTLR